MTTATRRIAVLTVAFGVVAPMALVTQPPAGLRMVLAAAVLLALPGFAAVAWLRLTDPFAATVVAIATSVAVTITVSSALLYLGIWSWPLGVGVVSTLTVLAAAGSLFRERSA